MELKTTYKNEPITFDLTRPMDISLPLSATPNNVTAWYVEQPRFEPVRSDAFTGSVKEGGTVNFRDIFFKPHGHGTHTECVGHISQEDVNISEVLKAHFVMAQVVTIEPLPFQGEHAVYR